MILKHLLIIYQKYFLKNKVKIWGFRPIIKPLPKTYIFFCQKTTKTIDIYNCARETIRNQYNPQNIYNMTPTELHYYIADWALSGNRLNEIGDCLWYLNPFKPTCNPTFPINGSGTIHTRLGDHCFYRPTAKYAET